MLTAFLTFIAANLLGFLSLSIGHSLKRYTIQIAILTRCSHELSMNDGKEQNYAK